MRKKATGESIIFRVFNKLSFFLSLYSLLVSLNIILALNIKKKFYYKLSFLYFSPSRFDNFIGDPSSFNVTFLLLKKYGISYQIIWYIVPERSEMSLPPLVPNFRDLANHDPVPRSRTEVYRELCDYVLNITQLEKIKKIKKRRKNIFLKSKSQISFF